MSEAPPERGLAVSELTRWVCWYGHLYPQGDDELIRRLERRAGFG